MEKRKVLQKVQGWDEKVLIRTGVVINVRGEMGVFLFMYDRKSPTEMIDAQQWTLLCPHDLITFWRASLILRKLEEIHWDDLANSYSIACRDISYRDEEEILEIGSRLNSDDYRDIMARKVPEKIVRLLKNHFEELSIPPYTVTDEVKAGTLQWDEKFSEYGVLHPEKEDELIEEANKNVYRYEKYLSKYASEKKIPRDSILFNEIADYLFLAVQRNIETNCGMSIALGFAITLGERSCSNFVDGMLDLYEDDEADFLHMDESFIEEVKEVSKWLSKNFREGLFRRPVFSKAEFQKWILNSVEEYELELDSGD
jgi:hypothetical protein